MTTAAEFQSGKGHRDENFPVASFLIQRRHRPAILSFYRFVRAADDVADHPTATRDEKLRLLDAFRATLLGRSGEIPQGLALRAVLAKRNLSSQHALDLLEAFRQDVTKLRYANWDELMEYCRYSAMPVGRFVLEVHGESRDIWPANDALCAALQVINHLQDCAKDYRALDRVYVPQDALAKAGSRTEELGEGAASPALRRVISALAQQTTLLLNDARPFASTIENWQLAFEVTVIQRLAEDLAEKLLHRDPLSERVHHRKGDLVPLLFYASGRFVRTRWSPSKRTQALGHPS